LGMTPEELGVDRHMVALPALALPNEELHA
jgi:hypothetical protein